MTLSDTDAAYLIRFVEEVIAVCRTDDTGATIDLIDLALNAGQILGLSADYMEELE